MNLPTPETVAAFANCSPTMAAHFLRAIELAASDQTAADSTGEPVPPLPSEALNVMARAAVSALRLMCMNPTQRDYWRVRDDGSLYCPPRASFNELPRAFNLNGEIEDAPPPAPER